MKKIKLVGSAVLTTAVLFFSSCEKENYEQNKENNTSEISETLASKLKKLNFNPNSATLKTITDIDGAQQKVYEIEGDILISEEELMAVDTQNADKQFASAYKVDLQKYPVIQVVGYVGDELNGLSAIAQGALIEAVQNYNSLNSSLRMELNFSTQRAENGILVYLERSVDVLKQDNTFDAKAKFPKSDGKPGKEIIINIAANNPDSAQSLESLLTHELGHALGLRHTDWRTRSSCRDVDPESRITEENGEGANYIPGTPGSGNDPNSVMNACIDYGLTKGELGDYDKKAIRFLYPN